MGLHGAASISRECDAVHASLEISSVKLDVDIDTLVARGRHGTRTRQSRI
jgi:hypothetical protein